MKLKVIRITLGLIKYVKKTVASATVLSVSFCFKSVQLLAITQKVPVVSVILSHVVIIYTINKNNTTNYIAERPVWSVSVKTILLQAPRSAIFTISTVH